MIIPGASPTGQMGGGSLHPSFPVVGRGLTKGLEVAIPVGLTVISLVGVGKFFKAAGAIRAADAALVRLYQTGRIPWLGASTYYPPGWIGPAITMMGGTLSTWFTPSSAGGGGPGEIPNLHRPPPSIEEAGEILTSAGQIKPTWVPPSKTKSPSRFKKAKYCPPGYYWSRSRRKCLPLEGANDYRRFKRRYRKKG